VTLRARWVTLRARWVTLRARWVTLRARWVTLRARWVQGDGGPADERPAQQSGQGAGAQAEAPPAMFASLGQVDRFVLSKAGGYEKFDLHHPGTLQDALLARSYRNEVRSLAPTDRVELKGSREVQRPLFFFTPVRSS
jgi:hypothetical protein